MSRWIVIAFFTLLWMLPAPPRAHAQDDPKVTKLIVQLLEDKDVKKRRLALLELEIIGKRARGVLQALTIALEKDSEPVVRREVALALARWGEDSKDAIGSLAFAMKNDKDDDVRALSARALQVLVPHSKSAMTSLIAALDDKHAPTRVAASDAIKALGPLAKPAIPRMMDYLKSGKDKKNDAATRMHIVLALGRVNADQSAASKVLVNVLADTDEDESVREAAAESLGRLGLDATGAANALADILKETKNSKDLRLAAVLALAKVEGETRQIWPALKVGLSDSDAAIRINSVRATGPYAKEEPEGVKTMAKIAKSDDNVEVRLAAIQELGLLGTAGKMAEADLRFIIANDERETVRQEAEAALKKIQGGNPV